MAQNRSTAPFGTPPFPAQQGSDPQLHMRRPSVTLAVLNRSTRERIRQSLRSAGCAVATLGERVKADPSVRRPQPDVLIASAGPDQDRGARLIRELRDMGWRIPMILLAEDVLEEGLEALPGVVLAEPETELDLAAMTNLVLDCHRYARLAALPSGAS